MLPLPKTCVLGPSKCHAEKGATESWALQHNTSSCFAGQGLLALLDILTVQHTRQQRCKAHGQMMLCVLRNTPCGHGMVSGCFVRKQKLLLVAGQLQIADNMTIFWQF